MGIHADVIRVEQKGWHLVPNKERYKVLLKRGESIKWSMHYDCWIWDFQNRKVQNAN